MDLLAQLTAALGDRYRVERELGHGGMAVVFLAEDLKHRRRVAIKVLKPELSAVLGGERFLREIGIAAALQHPHILPLYDSGQADGLLYYVMPYAEGESLRQRLAREQQLPLETALQITREVGSALQYAHDHGIVHRDIKPENIMLSGGQAVVADFGIARALSAAGADERITATRDGGRHAAVHEPGAGVGRDGGRPQRPVQPGLHPVRDADRRAAVQRTVAPGGHGPPLRRAGAQPADGTADGAAGGRGGDHAGDGEGPRRPLPFDAAVPGQPAGHGGRDGPGRRVRASEHPPSRADRARCRGPGRGRERGVVDGARAVGRASAITAVAVLPFEDFGNPDSSYLGQGMTDGLIADLAQIGSLKVISRSSGVMAEEKHAVTR